MQIGKDDRHVPDRLKKASTPLQRKGLLGLLLKPRVLMLVLVVILLMLIFIMSLSFDADNSSSTKATQRKEQPKKQAIEQKNKKATDTVVTDTVATEPTQVPNTEKPVLESKKPTDASAIARNPSETQYETGKKQTEVEQPIPVVTIPSNNGKANATTDKASEKTTDTESKPVTQNVQAEEKQAVATEKSDEKPAVVTDKPAATLNKADEKQATTESNKDSITKDSSKKDDKKVDNKKAAETNKADNKRLTNTNKSTKKSIIADERFSIQLVGATSLENVRKLIDQYNIKNGHIYETIRNNQSWYVLIQGDFPSIEAARDAIKFLPKEFQDNKAWVKAGVKINREMALVPNQPNQ